MQTQSVGNTGNPRIPTDRTTEATKEPRKSGSNLDRRKECILRRNRKGSITSLRRGITFPSPSPTADRRPSPSTDPTNPILQNLYIHEVAIYHAPTIPSSSLWARIKNQILRRAYMLMSWEGEHKAVRVSGVELTATFRFQLLYLAFTLPTHPKGPLVIVA